MAQFFSWLLIFHLGTILSITCTSLMKHLTFFVISLHKIFPLKFLSLKVRRLFGRMVKLFHELQCVLKCLCNCNCIIFVGTLLLVKEKEKKTEAFLFFYTKNVNCSTSTILERTFQRRKSRSLKNSKIVWFKKFCRSVLMS